MGATHVRAVSRPVPWQEPAQPPLPGGGHGDVPPAGLVGCWRQRGGSSWRCLRVHRHPPVTPSPPGATSTPHCARTHGGADPSALPLWPPSLTGSLRCQGGAVPGGRAQPPGLSSVPAPRRPPPPCRMLFSTPVTGAAGCSPSVTSWMRARRSTQPEPSVKQVSSRRPGGPRSPKTVQKGLLHSPLSPPRRLPPSLAPLRPRGRILGIPLGRVGFGEGGAGFPIFFLGGEGTIW